MESAASRMRRILPAATCVLDRVEESVGRDVIVGSGSRSGSRRARARTVVDPDDTNEIANRFEQLGLAERLRQEIVKANPDTLLANRLGHARGDGHDASVGDLIVLADRTNRLEPVDDRHDEVHEDELGSLGLDHFEPLCAVRRFDHDESERFEHRTEYAPILALVVDYENPSPRPLVAGDRARRAGSVERVPGDRQLDREGEPAPLARRLST